MFSELTEQLVEQEFYSMHIVPYNAELGIRFVGDTPMIDGRDITLNIQYAGGVTGATCSLPFNNNHQEVDCKSLHCQKN